MSKSINQELILEKLSRMIDYCKKDKSVNGLTALFQLQTQLWIAQMKMLNSYCMDNGLV